MTRFVHLTSEKNAKAIQRAGIKPPRYRGNVAPGVFVMPVTENFYISHQWLRELKSYGQRTIVGIYLKIPDSEKVLVGHYNNDLVELTASEACGLISRHPDPQGYQVIVPRKVLSKEVYDVRSLPQLVGWRYMPDSHKAHFCACPVCVRKGSVRSKIKNGKWEAQQRVWD